MGLFIWQNDCVGVTEGAGESLTATRTEALGDSHPLTVCDA